MGRRTFDYGPFRLECGRTVIVFDAQKYSMAEACAIAQEELETANVYCKAMFCYYGFGTECDGDVWNSYWITEEAKGNCFPVYAFGEIVEVKG